MHRCARTTGASFKLQAASHKRQASSDKQRALDKRLRIWDTMILNNRKDTYDNTTRGETTGPRCRNKGRVLGASLQRSQARHVKAGGKDRALRGHHSRAARHHRGLQVPAGDANQLRSRSGRRGITNRGLRAPSDGANRYRFLAGSPDPATSFKQQASLKPGPSFKRQAPSFKRQATSSKLLDRGPWIKYRGALIVGRC